MVYLHHSVCSAENCFQFCLLRAFLYPFFCSFPVHRPIFALASLRIWPAISRSQPPAIGRRPAISRSQPLVIARPPPQSPNRTPCFIATLNAHSQDRTPCSIANSTHIFPIAPFIHCAPVPQSPGNSPQASNPLFESKSTPNAPNRTNLPLWSKKVSPVYSQAFSYLAPNLPFPLKRKLWIYLDGIVKGCTFALAFKDSGSTKESSWD